MYINVDIKEHILHKSEIFNIYLVRNDPVYIQSKCYYYCFALVLIFIDMSLSENRDARAISNPFLSFGESGGRYLRPVFRGVSHPRCRHHGGTPKDRSSNDPEIIYSAGVPGGAAEGLMPSEFAQPRHNVAREIFFPSLVYSIY